jgi:hypothetical protein
MSATSFEGSPKLLALIAPATALSEIKLKAAHVAAITDSLRM